MHSLADYVWKLNSWNVLWWLQSLVPIFFNYQLLLAFNQFSVDASILKPYFLDYLKCWHNFRFCYVLFTYFLNIFPYSLQKKYHIIRVFFLFYSIFLLVKDVFFTLLCISYLCCFNDQIYSFSFYLFYHGTLNGVGVTYSIFFFLIFFISFLQRFFFSL